MLKNMLGGIAEAFGDANFRLYSLGAIVSWLSFFIQLVGVSWSTWELTHSTKWLAIIALLDIAPNLVFLPIGGVLADRYDRIRIVIITHIAALLQALALAILAYTGTLTVLLLAILAFLHGLIHSFSVPGYTSMMPRFVSRERLPSAIAVSSAYSQFAIFAGPALAGWIILHFGIGAAFATNVMGYAVYIATVCLMKTRADYQKPVPSGRSIFGDIVEGARYIARHSGISALLMLMLLGNAMSASVFQMLPAIANQISVGDVTGMANLMSASGMGATLAALWLAQGGARRATPQRVLAAFLALALAVAALALAGNLVLAGMAMLMFGFAGETRRTATATLLQLAVQDDLRGRVMGTQFLLQRVAGGFGIVLVGTIAEHHGLQLPLLAASGLAASAWCVAFGRRKHIFAAFARAG